MIEIVLKYATIRVGKPKVFSISAPQKNIGFIDSNKSPRGVNVENTVSKPLC